MANLNLVPVTTNERHSYLKCSNPNDNEFTLIRDSQTAREFAGEMFEHVEPGTGTLPSSRLWELVTF